MSFLLKEIVEGSKGKKIILSRADAEFVKKLFGREVPEIYSGSVEVKIISREPGVRTKMAVSSNQSGVDPVGSCVGQKGIRVQAVTNELGGERVDIIPYTEKMEDLIKAALAPAENLSVTLDKEAKIAKVKAPEDQLSLAIGRDGQNVRLVAKLTGWKIEIKEAGSVGKNGDDVKKKSVKSKKKEDVEKTKKKSKKGKMSESAETKEEGAGVKETKPKPDENDDKAKNKAENVKDKEKQSAEADKKNEPDKKNKVDNKKIEATESAD